ncbi:5-oxoprolinase subunit C family protein [Oceanobacillus manasiensis]|uniref:5-oxoprolinase subunit C family protein n=1 Tax=Oceanobacillus manasiensis TaxID=586413 RepID=UPI0005A7DA42|nr:biotin-dependent carboxyltransferase family protein [Oceanobacillus manasiensis]
MEQELFQVMKPGVQTTFQDLGRKGYQQFGVPVSGAMDKFALQVANILLGNSRTSPCLEITLIGPNLVAKSSMTIVITGANLNPTCNGEPIDMWKTVRIEKGDELAFGKHESGVRAYLAVAGGFEAPKYFGSSSVDGNSGFGKPLEKGDTIKGYPITVASGISLASSLIPSYEKKITVSLVEGPHTDYFAKKDRETFFAVPYKVGSNSNRMGYRLEGETIKPEKVEVWSDGIPFGGIQITSGGEPIILMADRQTTGGYPRIGTVFSTDLPRVAQLIPGGEICFRPSSIEEAEEKVRKEEQFLHRLEQFRQHIERRK